MIFNVLTKMGYAMILKDKIRFLDTVLLDKLQNFPFFVSRNPDGVENTFWLKGAANWIRDILDFIQKSDPQGKIISEENRWIAVSRPDANSLIQDPRLGEIPNKMKMLELLARIVHSSLIHLHQSGWATRIGDDIVMQERIKDRCLFVENDRGEKYEVFYGDFLSKIKSLVLDDNLTALTICLHCQNSLNRILKHKHFDKVAYRFQFGADSIRSDFSWLIKEFSKKEKVRHAIFQKFFNPPMTPNGYDEKTDPITQSLNPLLCSNGNYQITYKTTDQEPAFYFCPLYGERYCYGDKKCYTMLRYYVNGNHNDPKTYLDLQELIQTIQQQT